jgi:hypothetical protein
MTVKYTKWLMLAGMAILLMTMGCEKQMGSIAPEGDVGAAATSTLPYQYNPGGSWFTYFRFLSPGPIARDLSVGNDAGGNGYVTVWKAADLLYVQYQTTNGWFLAQVHVAVATNLDDIPHNNSGNMQPGKFPFPPKDEFNVDPYANLHIVEIPWDDDWDISPPDSLYMVAHCVVGKEVAPGETIWQTGTGGGGDPHKRLSLPTDPCSLSVTFPFEDSNSYWRAHLWNVPGDSGDYNVWNGYDWEGWCADEPTPIHQGWHYEVMLYSSLDPWILTQDRLDGNGQWDRVNWVLNNKSMWPGADLRDFQRAFDMMFGVKSYPDPNFPVANQIYDDAEAYGEGFVPGIGEWAAVICDAGPGIQPVFIKVDP